MLNDSDLFVNNGTKTDRYLAQTEDAERLQSSTQSRWQKTTQEPNVSPINLLPPLM